MWPCSLLLLSLHWCLNKVHVHNVQVEVGDVFVKRESVCVCMCPWFMAKVTDRMILGRCVRSWHARRHAGTRKRTNALVAEKKISGYLRNPKPSTALHTRPPQGARPPHTHPVRASSYLWSKYSRSFLRRSHCPDTFLPWVRCL